MRLHWSRLRVLVLVMALGVGMVGAISPASAHPTDEPGKGKDEATHGVDTPEYLMEAQRNTPCVRGMAGDFPCDDVNMFSYLPMADIGGGRGSDVWGWTDPEGGRRYVIAGRDNGTAFVDITNPTKPLYLGNLPTSGTQNVIWRDIKVFDNHAFIVSEAANHGMQVFDLTQLRDVDRKDAPATFTETALYREFGRSHNIAINEDTGFAYALGNREDVRGCQGGLHIIDINDPANPVFESCYAEDGYTHDAQCVVYEGPDARFTGQEVCLNSNEDTLTIVDVTDKAAGEMLARMPYDGEGYTHQGWLTEDQRYFLLSDEGDESQNGHNTRTYIWDVSDLTAPEVIGTYTGPTSSIDHNLYIKDGLVYESNYRAGLRILSLDDIAQGELTEVAFFDVYPPDDEVGFGHGTWSNYPYFDNGVVAVNGYEGLFILKPRGLGGQG